MGLEALCRCTVDGITAEAKVLLEARELILRSPFRRTIPIAALTTIEASGGELRLRADGSDVVLVLGAATAAKWARRLASQPPTLAAKLGIGHAAPAFVIGPVDDPELADVLDGHTAGPATARLSLAVIADAAALAAAVAAHEAAPPRAAIWIVHGKGPSATFGERPVREAMRARGYRDTKVAAVSATLTATRYSPG